MKSRTGGYWEQALSESPGSNRWSGVDTPLAETEFVAIDVETTGQHPFLVIEIGAAAFDLEHTIRVFDTLVECRARINPYARRRHHITSDMLVDAPAFGDARSAFLEFAGNAVWVQHSHDGFDSWLLSRGMGRVLDRPTFDTTRMASVLLELPKGRIAGLDWLAKELGVQAQAEHHALGDARVTAACFCRLVGIGRQRHSWETLGDLESTVGQARRHPLSQGSAPKARRARRRRGADLVGPGPVEGAGSGG